MSTPTTAATATTPTTQAPALTGTLAGLAPYAWLLGASVLGLVLYYFVGVDQGMVSLFGADTHVHELMHDARHLLAFACH